MVQQKNPDTDESSKTFKLQLYLTVFAGILPGIFLYIAFTSTSPVISTICLILALIEAAFVFLCVLGIAGEQLGSGLKTVLRLLGFIFIVHWIAGLFSKE